MRSGVPCCALGAMRTLPLLVPARCEAIYHLPGKQRARVCPIPTVVSHIFRNGRLGAVLECVN